MLFSMPMCTNKASLLSSLSGAGYHLVVVKTPKCKVLNLTRFIIQFVEGAELESIINQEVSYILPDDESRRFATLFRELDKHKVMLGIESYGTTATTMEEVFLK